FLAQRFQEKAAESIPTQHAQRVTALRQCHGPSHQKQDAAEEPPGYLHELYRDAPLPHPVGVVEVNTEPPVRFPTATTAVEDTAKSHPEAASEHAGAEVIPVERDWE